MLKINGIPYRDYRPVMEAEQDEERRQEWNAGALIIGILLVVVTIIVTF